LHWRAGVDKITFDIIFPDRATDVNGAMRTEDR
jgi:hypothetical protein